ncbi:hypothetical protein [Roseimaritima ulvae]|uniref:IncA protein n=1 Tax=Roseimaritima ulvae TaxID=980254 RepID=A0A5B9R8R4_9BACT|nr:hypothetical protein [Roseimaritima ulvae]QEG43251.1 hypothetical protein UC8_52980 [Roseimaritima ulvae]
MSGRRRATLSPTLFPFLAVLVCTLGTLILFLALVAQKAEQTAQEAVDDPAAPESVTSLVTEQQWRRERYVAIRESQTADLSERSSELAHIEDHIRRLRDQLQQLRAETQAASADSFDEQAKHQEIVLLKQAIAAEQEQLEQLQQEVASRPPRVVIVPHQGPHGTDQRPIYVECTAEGVVLQPEGAFISKLQLEGPAGTGNPLDAALRTIRYHWQQTDPDGPAPYPLLIVRPDGITSYAAARAAMQGWDDQFGYELVPGETELAFPAADSSLRARVDVAIREAVARQHARLAAASYTLRRAAARGTRPRVLSAADLARGDVSGGGSGQRYFSRSVTPETTSRSGSIAGSDIRDFDQALQSAAQQSGSGGLANLPGHGPATDLDIGLPQGTGNPLATNLESGLPHRGGESNSAATADGEGNGPGDVSGPGADSLAGQPPITGTGRADQHGRYDGNSQGPSTNEQNVRAATGGGAQPSSGNAGSKAPAQANPYAANGGSAAAAQASSPQSPSPSSSSKPTLQRGGKDWALPASARTHGTTIVRGVHVICLNDAFVLMPERAGGSPQRFAFHDGFVDRAAMELATAVHGRVESWGVAIAGGRWQPVLRVQVDRSSESRYRQLRTLLQGSGLELEKR